VRASVAISGIRGISRDGKGHHRGEPAALGAGLQKRRKRAIVS
jgi:hypothetical protein